jgi:hypothetical protein
VKGIALQWMLSAHGSGAARRTHRSKRLQWHSTDQEFVTRAAR